MSEKEITPATQIEQDELPGAELQPEKTNNTVASELEEEDEYKFGVTQALAFFVCFSFSLSILVAHHITT
jgi:hypothetical protein